MTIKERRKTERWAFNLGLYAKYDDQLWTIYENLTPGEMIARLGRIVYQGKRPRTFLKFYYKRLMEEQENKKNRAT